MFWNLAYCVVQDAPRRGRSVGRDSVPLLDRKGVCHRVRPHDFPYDTFWVFWESAKSCRHRCFGLCFPASEAFPCSSGQDCDQNCSFGFPIILCVFARATKTDSHLCLRVLALFSFVGDLMKISHGEGDRVWTILSFWAEQFLTNRLEGLHGLKIHEHAALMRTAGAWSLARVIA